MSTLIPIEDSAKFTPIVKINADTGKCHAYSSASSAARSLVNDDNKAATFKKNIVKACETGELFCSHFWRQGEILIAPKGFSKGTGLVGMEINGYVVKEDSGRVLSSGEKLFLCTCTSCGATRVFGEYALSFGVLPKCGCANSIDLLGRSEPIQRPMEVEDIREKILSSLKGDETKTTEHNGTMEAPLNDAKGGETEGASENATEWDSESYWVKYFTDAAARSGKRTVLKYSEDGKTYLGEYDNSRLAYLDAYVLSAIAAGKPVNPVGYEFIERCCRGTIGTVTAFGFRWVYADSSEEKKRSILLRCRGRGGRKNLFQFHLASRKFITRYDSAMTAYCALHPDKAKTLPKKELQKLAKGITDCCRHITDSFEGFLWMFADEYMVSNTPDTKGLDDAVNAVIKNVAQTLVDDPTATNVEEKVK